MEDVLLTRKQVGEKFSVSSETIKLWQKKGIIKPHCIINGRPRYNKESIEAVVKQKV